MSLIKIERYLETNGWKRGVAGDEDFHAALLAVEKMVATGRGLVVSGEYGVGKTATWSGEDPKSDAVRVKYCQGVKKLLNFFAGP